MIKLRFIDLLLPLVVVLVLMGCAQSGHRLSLPTFDEPLTVEQTLTWAQTDFAIETNKRLDEIEVVGVHRVIWSNGAIGCPKPNQSYTQALVPGYQIILRVNQDRVYYHSRRGETPFLCPTANRVDPIQRDPSVL